MPIRKTNDINISPSHNNRNIAFNAKIRAPRKRINRYWSRCTRE